MKSRYILLLTSILLLPVLASAQGTFLGGTYSIGIPLGNTGKYIHTSSFRGGNFEGIKEINSGFAIGWLLGWNVFYEKRNGEVYVNDNLTLTGTQYRYKNLFPILARGLYEFGQPEQARPYVGAGAGFTPDVSRTNVGLYSFQKSGWHFSVAPEIGIRVPISYASVYGSLRYTYGVKTKDLGNIAYFSFNLGMLWGE